MKILILGGDSAMYACLLSILRQYELIAFESHQDIDSLNQVLSRHERNMMMQQMRKMFYEAKLVPEIDPPNPAICAKNCRKLGNKGRTR
jgi:hypothetical protein